jgi:hypothetical protein
VLDWRKKAMTWAGVRKTIEIMLDYLPEVFDKSLYEKKCDAPFASMFTMPTAGRDAAFTRRCIEGNIAEWFDWKPFSEPRKGGYLVAPFGPGDYEWTNWKVKGKTPCRS